MREETNPWPPGTVSDGMWMIRGVLQESILDMLGDSEESGKMIGFWDLL